MRKRRKFIYFALLFGLISVIFFISFGLYTMEIEDHFGDLQEFYYKSKDGDLVINRSKSDFGILEKNWKRMYVKQKEARTDFVNWIYKDGFLEGNEVYRTDLKPADIEKMTYHDLVIIIRESDLKPILQN